jgi:hypothetical protein
MTLADYSKFMLCDKFCIQWLLPCMDALECVVNTIQYKEIGFEGEWTHAAPDKMQRQALCIRCRTA